MPLDSSYLELRTFGRRSRRQPQLQRLEAYLVRARSVRCERLRKRADAASPTNAKSSLLLAAPRYLNIGPESKSMLLSVSLYSYFRPQ